MFLSFLLGFNARVNGASVYDTWISPPTSLGLQVASCSPLDVTLSWRDLIDTANTTLTPTQKSSLITAFDTGVVSVSQHEESGYRVLLLIWTTTPDAYLNWSANGVLWTGTKNRAVLYQNDATGCNVFLGGFAVASGSYEYFESPVSFAQENKYFRIYVNGLFTPNYPVGYEGNQIIPYEPPPVPTDYETIVLESVDIVADNIGFTVKLALFLATANFILQWGVSAMNVRKRDFTNDNN